MPTKPDLNALKLVMAEQNMSIAELSEKTGIREKTLLRILEGQRELKVPEIFALSDALNLSDKRKSEIFLSRKLN